MVAREHPIDEAPVRRTFEKRFGNSVNAFAVLDQPARLPPDASRNSTTAKMPLAPSHQKGKKLRLRRDDRKRRLFVLPPL